MQLMDLPEFAELGDRAMEMARMGWMPSTQAGQRSALRAFARYEQAYEDRRPVSWQMPTPGAGAMDLASSLHNELTLMYFATTLHAVGLAASTVATYVSHVRGRFSFDLGFPVVSKDSVRLPKLLRAIRRLKSSIRRKRVGFRAHHHRKWRKALGPITSYEMAVEDAVLAVGREGLCRGEELGPKRPKAFRVAGHPCVGDLSFRLYPEKHAVLMILPAKQNATQKVEVLLPKGDGVTDAYAALKRLQAWKRKLGVPEREYDPLFEVGGMPLTKHLIAKWVKKAGEVLGIDPKTLGSHSLRIAGATDMFATGTSPALIQIQGRWSSDLWQIYARQCIGQTLEATRRGGACEDADLEELDEDYVQPARVTRCRRG